MVSPEGLCQQVIFVTIYSHQPFFPFLVTSKLVLVSSNYFFVFYNLLAWVCISSHCNLDWFISLVLFREPHLTVPCTPDSVLPWIQSTSLWEVLKEPYVVLDIEFGLVKDQPSTYLVCISLGLDWFISWSFYFIRDFFLFFPKNVSVKRPGLFVR